MASVVLYRGDMREVLRGICADSVDSVVTDPPYHLTSIVKRFQNGEPAHTKTAQDIAARSTPIARLASGFMGKKWDGGDVAFDPATWAEVWRVLKPGGHLLAMGGTRTYHRLVCAVEDAGFEVRDTLMWLYGTGFPKSHNLKDAWSGWGTALKPAVEPIVLARKPLSEQTVAANVLRWGTGALNIDGCRVGSDGGTRMGRWPANVLHDGSEEVVCSFPDSKGQLASVGPEHGDRKSVNVYGDYGPRNTFEPRRDSGSAARFFYSAKASKGDRAGSKHPTVKPVALMRWLVRLVTPPGGLVLDPFAGSGTTGQAAREEEMRALLIEREGEYIEDIKRRLAVEVTEYGEKAEGAGPTHGLRSLGEAPCEGA